TQTNSVKKETGVKRENGEVKVDSTIPDQGPREETAPPATPAPVDEPRGTKRPFQPDDSDGAMDASTLRCGEGNYSV
ncbi:MAG: hypothetical protein Q9196_007462, partial [Gyalolechia fulgens]